MHIYINVFISPLRGRVSSNLLFKWETELDLTINTRIIDRRYWTLNVVPRVCLTIVHLTVGYPLILSN